MEIKKYILVERKPVECNDLLTWASWLEMADRRVAHTVVGDIRISTVFLGLDHQYGNGPPLLFETMIFGGPHDLECWRYPTWEIAETGHAEAVKLTQLALH